MNRFLSTLAKSIKTFLIHASGARPELVSAHPTEADHHAALGGMVCLTSLFSACGMAKILLDAGVQTLAIVPFAWLWGAIVFWLDRLLLMADPKPTSAKTRTKLALRFVFALCVALTVSESFVQALFHNEVKAERQFETLEARRINHDAALQSTPELVALRNSKQQKQQELAAKAREVSFWRNAYIAEAEGTAGTHIVGKGDVFNEKKANYELAMKEQAQIQRELATIDQNLQNREAEFRRTVEEANQNSGAPGFLANHRALLRVLSREPTGCFLYIAIALTMIIIETYALVAKTGRRSVHDSIAAEDVDTTITLAERQGKVVRTLVENCASAVENGKIDDLDETQRSLAKKMLEHAHSEVLRHLVRLRPGEAADSALAPTAFQRVSIEHAQYGVIVAECLVDSTLEQVVSSVARISMLREDFEPIAAAMVNDEDLVNAEGVPLRRNVPLLPQIAPSFRVLFRKPQYAAGVVE
jgi:Domain of unknown function (DUF4407)